MNVLTIITDTMRIDDLGCFGNEMVKTPHLDRLAAEGARFGRYYTEGLPTVPARRAYDTGRFTLPSYGWQPLEPDEVLLQEVLWERGYLTAFVSDVYHLFKPHMGFGRGFGHVHAVRGRELDPWIDAGDVSDAVEKHYREPDDGETLSKWYTRETLTQYLRNRIPFGAADGWKHEDDHFAAQVARAAVAWLEQCVRAGRKDKLYLCVDIFAPHAPIDPPPPYDRMYTDPDSTSKDIIIPRVGPIEGYFSAEELDHLRRHRAGFVTFVDRCVGVLLDWMGDHGMLEDTLIVYVSDHGDFFGEHGLLMKCRPWPYDILSHAPLIIRHPECGHGTEPRTFAQSTDLMPTVLDALGIPLPESVQGVSLLPAVADEEEMLREFAVAGFHKRSESIRDGEWSYYRWLGKNDEKTDPELFHLAEDPAEMKDVIADHREVAARLDQRLSAFMDGVRS